MSRAALFRRRTTAAPPPLRPPWALTGETAFLAACDGCAKCIPVCETEIISKGADDKPVVSFADAGCTLCGACADACPTGALFRGDGRRAWRHVARIGATCLSYSGVECRVCGDHCEARAITFTPLGRGRWLPVVGGASCTGCGACLAPCPADAITVEALTNAPFSTAGENACA